MTLLLHSCIRLFATFTAVVVENSRMQLCSCKVIISVIFFVVFALLKDSDIINLLCFCLQQLYLFILVKL